MTNRLLLESNSLFLSGPFGSGKTTAAVRRVQRLLRHERVRGDQILVLVPQRSLGQPYHEALSRSDTPPGAPVQVATVASLARASVSRYWPLVAPEAGFADPSKEPTFLSLETTQYHMDGLVRKAVDQGEFDSEVIRLQPGRIVSQVLDNLNKSALHDFTIEEAYQRLENTVPAGEKMTARLNVFRSARRLSQEFRQLCQRESLVDYSLQMHIFLQHILTNSWCRTHLFRSYRHLVLDNAEEETFAGLELVRRWLPLLDSALIVVDDDGGYRAFLGADPAGAERLAECVRSRARFDRSHTLAPALSDTADTIDRILRQDAGAGAVDRESGAGSGPPTSPSPLNIPETTHRFFPQLIAWAVAEIERLVKREGVAPGQIAVLAPFVNDALRFSIQSRLAERGIPFTSHRPSRALNAEPAVRTLITLADLAHPEWRRSPLGPDVGLALGNAVAQLDPVRASVLAQAAYRPQGGIGGELLAFEDLRGDVQKRVTFALGELYERLRDWLAAYRAETDFTPIDGFFARVFGELLSQPGFGFHDAPEAARLASQLASSARSFRWAVAEGSDLIRTDGAQAGSEEADSTPARRSTAGESLSEPAAMGRAYAELVEGGALGALYLPAWTEAEDAVFIAPAYTFLLRNRTVDVQIWLDVGSEGWGQRIYQPLTHPFVLTRGWPVDRSWSDLDEVRSRRDSLRRLVIGLLRRARGSVILGLSDLGEGGFEQRGPLLGLLNRLQIQT